MPGNSLLQLDPVGETKLHLRGFGNAALLTSAAQDYGCRDLKANSHQKPGTSEFATVRATDCLVCQALHC